jgi:hypothetical protein
LRNSDFNFPDQIKNITYVAKFYKGDEYQYESVMFVNTISIFTGFKTGAFSVSLNQRTPSDTLNVIDLLKNIGMVFLGYNPPSWSLRDTLATCDNF